MTYIQSRFWELAIKTASPQSQRRFIKTYRAYIQAVVQEAVDRGRKHIRNVEEYFEVRRDTIGTRPSFALLELDMNLPEKAVQHPVIEEMTILATDMIILDNVSWATFRYLLRLIDRSRVGCRILLHIILSRHEATTATTSSPSLCISTRPTFRVP